MEILEAKIVDFNEPLSKTFEEIFNKGTAVLVTRNNEYIGLIDDRNMRTSISDPSKTKCGNISVRSPVLFEDSTIEETMNAFMTGHFKALPVLTKRKRIAGITTRAELLRELIRKRLLPKVQVDAIMNKPVRTIDESATLGEAKGLMKNSTRLIVTKLGKVQGVVSTFDINFYVAKPRQRDFLFNKGVSNISDINIGSIDREDLVIVEQGDALEKAVKMMAEKNVSSAVVVSGRKPVGLLSASDIFKVLLKLMESEPAISISGLKEEDISHYYDIQTAVLAVVKKFSKAFRIADIVIHVKKGKSTYTINGKMGVGNKRLTVSAEEYDLKSAVERFTKELKTLLEKMKVEKMVRKKVEREI